MGHYRRQEPAKRASPFKTRVRTVSYGKIKEAEGTLMHLPVLEPAGHPTRSCELISEEESSTSIGARIKHGRSRSELPERIASRSKPQIRIFVQHNYHDHANDVGEDKLVSIRNYGKNPPPFPSLLHTMLEEADSRGYSEIISWCSHGRAFHVHDQTRFSIEVMPLHFRQTRFSSFQRQLSLYGFLRLVQKGPDHSAYYHELFLRGRCHLVDQIHRTRVKGCMVRQSSSPQTEPDFYTMPAVCPYGDSKPDQHAFHHSTTEAPEKDTKEWSLPTRGLALASLESFARLPSWMTSSTDTFMEDKVLPPMPPLCPAQPNLGLGVDYLTQPVSALDSPLQTTERGAAATSNDLNGYLFQPERKVGNGAAEMIASGGQDELAAFLSDVGLSEQEGYVEGDDLGRVLECSDNAEGMYL